MCITHARLIYHNIDDRAANFMNATSWLCNIEKFYMRILTSPHDLSRWLDKKPPIILANVNVRLIYEYKRLIKIFSLLQKQSRQFDLFVFLVASFRKFFVLKVKDIFEVKSTSREQFPSDMSLFIDQKFFRVISTPDQHEICNWMLRIFLYLTWLQTSMEDDEC